MSHYRHVSLVYIRFLDFKQIYLPTMNCPLTLTSAVDDCGESFDAPASELTDELNDGTVRTGRRGRTLIN
jgi:hypothetical protein